MRRTTLEQRLLRLETLDKPDAEQWTIRASGEADSLDQRADQLIEGIGDDPDQWLPGEVERICKALELRQRARELRCPGLAGQHVHTLGNDPAQVIAVARVLYAVERGG